jgi:hypothetical protein
MQMEARWGRFAEVERSKVFGKLNARTLGAWRASRAKLPAPQSEPAQRAVSRQRDSLTTSPLSVRADERLDNNDRSSADH